MRWDSFRVRLTLWNMAVLALVLGGFGLALCYSIQSWMSWSIDQELAQRAHRPFRGLRSRAIFRGVPGRPAGGFDPFHRRRIFRGSVPPGDRVGLPIPGLSALTTTGRRSFQDWPVDPETERRASFLRPRLLGLHGEGLDPLSAQGAWDPDTLPEAIAGHACV